MAANLSTLNKIVALVYYPQMIHQFKQDLIFFKGDPEFCEATQRLIDRYEARLKELEGDTEG